ncbi:alpha-2-HS-glycoprotein 1 [Cynoglossus semilaevis]|uniref:Alpha-2-HS-glycoprotein n=1 Tax=Cynoglossus semilaevis TaxID=244447 RepID=A0A3P8WST5_CYNSE|nr:alpha-2-HS-glycoprotein [Cynoglossus semilaevis]
MRTLQVVVLLCWMALLCSAAPPTPNVTCSDDSEAAAARLALHRINQNHRHGYKFMLWKIKSNTTEKVEGGCRIELELDLKETKCHVVNPKPIEECGIRSSGERVVIANCTVTVEVYDADFATQYKCDTKQEISQSEMSRMCPDCPVMLPHTNPTTLSYIQQAVKEFNKNSSEENVYVLQEVGRVTSGYMMEAGMGYFFEFLMVETDCKKDSRIAHPACKPLCFDRAHHFFCTSSATTRHGLGKLNCESYPPLNTEPRGPGEQPKCDYAPPSRVGPPAPSSGKVGPPSHKESVPLIHPTPQVDHVAPPPPIDPCHISLSKSNPALHPICPFPLP